MTKPNPDDFMHKGKLNQAAYDAAMRAWNEMQKSDQSTEPTVVAPTVIAPTVIGEAKAPDVPDKQPELNLDEVSDANTTVIATDDPITFKMGVPTTWHVTPLAKDGTPASIQPNSLKVSSGNPSVEVSVSSTSDNTFVLIPIGAASAELTVSFRSTYGKLVTRTYQINIVEGSDEAVDMKVEYTVQA